MTTLIEHWDGVQWSIVASPNPSTDNNYLWAVAAVSTDDVWAVGYYGPGWQTLTEHYGRNCPTPSQTPTSNATETPLAHTTTATPILTPILTATPTTTIGTPTPCLMDFSDVHPTDYFYEAVHYLYCHGVISGYSDGTFRPYNATTRAQTCKIVVLAEGWPTDCPPQVQHFSDVPPSDPFFCYIETAVAHHIVSGYADGTFRPYNDVTRGQICKIIVLAEGWADNCPPPGHFSDVPPGSPFFCYIETAYAHGIISGYADGTFRPHNSTTRGQLCKIVYGAILEPGTPWR